MAIIKWSQTGKQMQVILSEDLPAGTVLGVANSILPSVQNKKTPFATLTIMAYKTDPDRFPKSQVYLAGEGTIEYDEAVERGIWNDEQSTDVFDPTAKKKREQKHAFTDKEVSW